MNALDELLRQAYGSPATPTRRRPQPPEATEPVVVTVRREDLRNAPPAEANAAPQPELPPSKPMDAWTVSVNRVDQMATLKDAEEGALSQPFGDQPTAPTVDLAEKASTPPAGEAHHPVAWGQVAEESPFHAAQVTVASEPAPQQPEPGTLGHASVAPSVTSPEAPPPLEADVTPEDPPSSTPVERVVEEPQLPVDELVVDEPVVEQQVAEIDHPFKPQWEVDQFLWPDFQQQLASRVGTDLQSAAERIVQQVGRTSTKVIVLTSPHQGAGCSGLTLGLARSLASPARSVAVVDLDHASPVLMERLGVVVDEGVESLTEVHDADRVAVHSLEDAVTLLPLTRPTTADQCAGTQVQEMLSRLAAHHEIVLVDASAEVARQLSMSPLAFGWIVIRDQRSDAAAATELQDRLEQGQHYPLGVIDNFAA